MIRTLQFDNQMLIYEIVGPKPLYLLSHAKDDSSCTGIYISQKLVIPKRNIDFP